ncbi:MAG: tetratricopeptide repeat protein [Planctomycetota bacterium]|jgi:tetratricopeptide (TPR) repeat protein
MAVRQEQLVFAGACLLAGFLVWKNSDGGSDASRRRTPSNAAQLEQFPPPAVDRLSAATGADGRLQNALFSPPRDTRELDPLAFVPPPRPALIALAPPPVDLEPSLYAQFLHARPGDLEDAFSSPLDALEEALTDFDGAVAESADLSALGLQELSLAQRMELIESYKQVYDYVRLGEGAELQFGRVQNEDPWGLLFGDRILEPVKFIVFDAETGAPRLPGAPPIELTRDRVTELGFAGTPTNELELAYRALPPEPTPGTADAMLALADRCIELRHEAPRAFELARELYAKVAAFRPDDVQPGVGLARCLELELDLVGAIEAYDGLCERFGHRPEPWIGRARLESGLMLYEQAEKSLREAARVDKSGWRSGGALGRFLLDRDRPTEALELLAQANQNAPQATEDRDLRTALRSDYARALLCAGRVEEARGVLAQALRAAPEDQGLAGLALSAERLGADPLAVPADLDAYTEDGGVMGFDLLVAGAHRDAARGDWLEAGDALRAAIEVDPLRTAEALRLLSWISEATGSSVQAALYADAALAADPTYAWTLFQRARLALAEGDTESARANLEAALTLESEFEDALALIAEMHFQEEDHVSAERFLERALVLAERRVQRAGGGEGDTDQRADLLSLRGLNAIELQRFTEARAHFERALNIDRQDFLSRAGLAWCEYRLDATEEARVQLRNLDDTLRAEADGDPRRVWAREQLARIEEHLAKDIWSDNFEYTKIGNDWKREEVVGPVARLEGGVLFLEGIFRTSGQARFYREYNASEFVALEADVWIGAQSTSRAGLFVARENRRSAGDEVQALLSIARARDGVAQIRLLQPGRRDDGWADLSRSDFPFPTDTWMRLRIEREGQGSDTLVNLYMDGIPVAEGVPMAGLGRQNSPLKLGVFAEGESGRVADVRMDNVDVTRRRR